MHAMKVFATAIALVTAWCATAVHAGELEVLHFWDVGDDARAVNVLKSTLQRQGHTWKDFAVTADANGFPLFLLRSRVQSGNPPAAAQVKAPVIQQWAREGALANLDATARAGQWDAVLPRVVSDAMKYKGSYVAVPANIHRVNWLWINTRILKRANAQVPVTWDDFFAAAGAMKRAGYIAVTHGGQPWQDFLLFENVVLGVGGPEFYRKAFVALDPGALAGPVMEQALQTFRRIKPYTDVAAMGRNWNVAASRLANGEAGMQFMGDWAKPIFQTAQRRGNLEFACVPAPGTAKSYAYTVDSFALFKVNSPAKTRAQQDFAADLLAPGVQEEFNLVKGSIPVRQGVDLTKFDRCAKQSAAAFEAASRGGTLVPSISMALPPTVEDAMREAVSAYWHDDRITARATMQRLVAAARRP
ncbi:sugar ABC transporter substrate-binding protein [Massilia sp. Root133]|nr:sugar ABC transporter substrate-binding protein [Massilia sp. Root133]KQZ50965.1 sugar ABC transporter substrate-binding protein [Massilia sp. Root1485]